MNISIIVCTYNRAKILTKALTSMEKLDVPSDVVWEVLVVDNNSSDGTRDVVTYYVQQGKLPIRYVFEPQQGLCYARNRGIHEAQAPILAFTDDDALFDSHWLRGLLEAFKKYDCVGVGGRVIATWDFPKPTWLEASGMNKILNGPIVSHDFGDNSQPYTRSGMPMPVGTNMAFRREVFERWGQFRIELDRTGKSLLSGGDTEFCQRLLDYGETLIYYPDAVVYHPVEPHRATKRYFRRWMGANGRTWIRMRAEIPQGKTLFGVPLWHYSKLIRMIVQYLMYKVSFNPQRHAAELRLVQQLGKIYEEQKQWRH